MVIPLGILPNRSRTLSASFFVTWFVGFNSDDCFKCDHSAGTGFRYTGAQICYAHRCRFVLVESISIVKGDVFERLFENYGLNARLDVIRYADLLRIANVEIIQKEEPVASRRLLIRIAICCIKRWAEYDSEHSSFESTSTSQEICDNDGIGLEERKHKVNYFISHLLPVLSETITLSDDNLENLLDIPLSILDVVTVKLNMRVNSVIIDIRSGQSQEDKELEENFRNNIRLALTIFQCILVFKQGDLLTDNLIRGANVLQKFLKAISNLNEKDKQLFLDFQELAHRIIMILRSNDVESKDDVVPSFIDESEKSRNSRRTEVYSLEEIKSDLLDKSEPIRGHALIMLAKGIRERNKRLLEDIFAYPKIMSTVMEHVADSDSYVYLSAINAMVELAYWKQQFFDEMVEFFLDPVEKLQSLLKRDGNIPFNFIYVVIDSLKEDEKETYLIIQRVKIGEAISKACKTLGQMAPSYFDRIVNPMLSLIFHTTDDQLRASVLSSLSDLIISCRGLNIHKHINEMMLVAKLNLRDAEAEIVRRAAVNLMRSIVRTYDISLLQQGSTYLYDIADLLSYILDQDEDLVVKTHAMLCLQDINAQIEEDFSEFEKAYVRKIRF
ncbi:unnamed protein product [Thelazia callipaeda]|uniref:RTP1_C1 domain-containing protein n=1 Tax=Thelazia callipaeda TaxID=103827 RepID=A0A0N5CWW8_THECL|nr:unnamed protein product [Thelazia callipaeda]